MAEIPPDVVLGDENGCRILCLATPRASRNALAGWHDGRLKIALAAPPVDGEANAALVKFMASVLGVPKKDVAIVSGDTGRRKCVAVSNISKDKVINILQSAIK